MNISDIGVVIQGAFNEKLTPYVIASVRKFLPGAFIVLSTWEGTKDIQGVDLQVNNKDPGASILDKRTGQLNNLNRQIVSSYNGIVVLKKMGFEYVLKLRSDTCLTSCNFLNYWNKREKRWSEYKVFDKRVIICSKYVRPSWLLPFHISDWTFFGTTGDLLRLFDIKLEPSEYVNWFRDHPLRPEHKFHLFKYFRHRYCAEQYIWYSCLSKYYKVQFNDMFDTSDGNIGKSDSSICNNFMVLDDVTFGIKYLKFKTTANFCFMEKDWIRYYNIKTGSNERIKVKGIKLLEGERKKAKNKFKSAISQIPSCSSIADAISYGIEYLIKSIGRHFVYGVLSRNAERRYFCGICYKQIRQDGRYIKAPSFIANKLMNVNPWKIFIENLDGNIDRIVCLETATGETTLIASNIKSFFKSPDTTAFVFFRKSSKDIFDFISRSKYKTVLANEYNLTNSDDDEFERIISGKIVTKYFPYDFWQALWNSQKTFTDIVYEKIGIKVGNIDLFEFNPDELEKTRRKLRELGLRTNRFVVIAPEAASIQQLPKKFWIDKIKQLKLNGFDVFVNMVDNIGQSYEDTITLNVGIVELIYIIKCSTHFYSVRSGLCELAAITGVDMDVYYPKTNTKWPKLKFFHENYRFDQYIVTSNVREHIVE